MKKLCAILLALVLLLGLLEEDYKATMGGCQDGNRA